jgi:hypothetical protein
MSFPLYLNPLSFILSIRFTEWPRSRPVLPRSDLMWVAHPHKDTVSQRPYGLTRGVGDQRDQHCRWCQFGQTSCLIIMPKIAVFESEAPYPVFKKESLRVSIILRTFLSPYIHTVNHLFIGNVPMARPGIHWPVPRYLYSSVVENLMLGFLESTAPGYEWLVNQQGC